MPAKRSTVTMKDVADSLRLSKQTVSAVLNNKSGIPPRTRERVLAAVAELGYRRDSIARSLRTRQTHTIALLVSDASSPFIGELAVSAEQYLYQNGYGMILYNTHDDVAREAAYFNDAIERIVDGVIFVSATDDNPGLTTLASAGVPFVAVDRIPNPYDGPSVTLDNFKAGQLAAEHLLALGHRRVVHITGPSWVMMSRERLAGFRDTFQGPGRRAEVAIENAMDWSAQQGYLAMQRILDSSFHPTAVFAGGDLMAIGSMAAIREAGLSVPRDISVIGFDDLPVAAFQNPPLTTIRQSITELARLGAQLLLDILDDKEPSPTVLVMEPELIVRQSTASASAD